MHSQYYIKYYYNELLKTVQRRQFKDVPFKLRKIGLEQGSTFNYAEMTADFDKHKTGMIKGILWILKRKEDYGLTGKDFVDVVKGARKIGINWPELDIIEKSAAAMPPDISLFNESNKVNESDKPSIAQMDSNRRYSNLLQDLRIDEYDDIVLWFYMLGGCVKPTNTTPKSIEIVNSHKTGILRKILECVKYPDHYGYDTTDLQYIILGSRKIGLTWPELDIIEKSINSYKTDTIDESDGMSNEQHEANHPFNEQHEANHQFDKFINDLVSNEYDDIRIWLLLLAIRKVKPNNITPKSTEIINSHKTDILRKILECVKYHDHYGYDTTDLQYILLGLRKIGLMWPELDTIEKSVGKLENTAIDDARKELTNADAVKEINKLFGNGDDRLVWVQKALQRLVLLYSTLCDANKTDVADIKTAIDSYKHQIIKDMLHNMKGDGPKIDIPRMIHTLRNFGIDWPELLVFDRSVGTKIDETMRVDRTPGLREKKLEKLEQIFNDLDTDVFDRVIELYIAFGIFKQITQDDVDKILAKYKPAIVKDILHHLRYGVVDVNMDSTVETLRFMGANWPELDVIEKSFAARNNNGQLQEDFNEFWANSFMGHRMKSALRSNDFYEVPYLLFRINLHGNEIKMPDLSKAFNKRKHGIMSAILSAIKDPDEYNLVDSVFGEVVNGARRIGVNWPELDIIEKSLGNAKKPLDEARTRDEQIHYEFEYDILAGISALRINERNLADYPNYERIVNNRKGEIIRRLLQMLKDEENSLTIFYVDDLHSIGVTWPELDVIYKSAKLEHDKFFTYNDPDQLYESDKVNFYVKLIGERLKDAYFNDLPLLLCDVSASPAANHPNMSQAFNRHKTAIMRVILKAVKNPEDFDSDNDDIKNHLTNGARLLGVDWPELAIIDKSTGHTSLKESTSNDASANYNLGGVLSSIESDEPREMVLFLCNLHYVAHMPKVAFVLQPHIRFIVKALLEFLKHETEDAAPVETVRDCLEVLARMRVTSPELNIIQRSLNVKSKGPDRE